LKVGYTVESNRQAGHSRTVHSAELGGKVASRDDLCGESLGSSFGTACVVDKSFATGELLEDLEVHVPSLTTSDGPLPIDDDDWNSADPTLAGFLDLIFDCLNILFRVEVCNGLVLTHEARRLGDFAEDTDIRNILLVDDESLE